MKRVPSERVGNRRLYDTLLIEGSHPQTLVIERLLHIENWPQSYQKLMYILRQSRNFWKHSFLDQWKVIVVLSYNNNLVPSIWSIFNERKRESQVTKREHNHYPPSKAEMSHRPLSMEDDLYEKTNWNGGGEGKCLIGHTTPQSTRTIKHWMKKKNISVPLTTPGRSTVNIIIIIIMIGCNQAISPFNSYGSYLSQDFHRDRLPKEAACATFLPLTVLFFCRWKWSPRQMLLAASNDFDY